MLISVLMAFLPVCCYGNPVELEEARIYVESSQVVLTDQWMIAFIEGEWVPIDVLYKDSQGYYVALRKDPNHNRWICPICNYNNNGWDKTCQREYGNGEKCGYPRPW